MKCYSVQGMLPLQGSSVSIGGKKQLAVVGPENVETLQKTAMSASEIEAVKPKPAVSLTREQILSRVIWHEVWCNWIGAAKFIGPVNLTSCAYFGINVAIKNVFAI